MFFNKMLHNIGLCFIFALVKFTNLQCPDYNIPRGDLPKHYYYGNASRI
jgi:hypothetical protein